MRISGDKIGEIVHNIRNNKLRVLLTGLSVSWGIFMLILLLGSGYGIENGVRRAYVCEGCSRVATQADLLCKPRSIPA